MAVVKLLKKLDEIKYKTLIDLDIASIRGYLADNDFNHLKEYFDSIAKLGNINDLYYYFAPNIKIANEQVITDQDNDRFIDVIFHEYLLTCDQFNPDIIKLFLDCGADFYQPIKGKTILQKAFISKNYKLAEYLIDTLKVKVTLNDLKEGVNNNNIHALHYMIWNFDNLEFDSCETKLRTKLNFFEYCVKVGHYNIVAFLLKGYKDSLSKETIDRSIHIAIESPSRINNDGEHELTDTPEIIALLIKYGGDLNCKYQFTATNFNHPISPFNRAVNKFQNNFDSNERENIFRSIKVIIENTNSCLTNNCSSNEALKNDEVYKKYAFITYSNDQNYHNQIIDLIKYFREIRAAADFINECRDEFNAGKIEDISSKFIDIFNQYYNFFLDKNDASMKDKFEKNVCYNKYYYFICNDLLKLRLSADRYYLLTKKLFSAVREIEKHFKYCNYDINNKICKYVNLYIEKSMDIGNASYGINDKAAIIDVYELERIESKQNKDKLYSLLYNILMKSGNKSYIDWSHNKVQNSAYFLKYIVEKYIDSCKGSFDFNNFKKIFVKIMNNGEEI